jgi:hypothetical protein
VRLECVRACRIMCFFWALPALCVDRLANHRRCTNIGTNHHNHNRNTDAPTKKQKQRARPRAVERGVRRAVRAPRRLALRRQPQPRAAAHAVPGDFEARSRQCAGAVSGVARGARHRHERARRAVRFVDGGARLQRGRRWWGRGVLWSVPLLPQHSSPKQPTTKTPTTNTTNHNHIRNATNRLYKPALSRTTGSPLCSARGGLAGRSGSTAWR